VKFYCDEEKAEDVREWLNEKGNEKYFYSISKPNKEEYWNKLLLL
tara:strand:- start:4579 stop:4713 length:135 start_codon:yes stop_codon:yes gene_type:complete